MTCQYCRASNDAEAHRCARCGRRLGETIAPLRTAVAPALEPAPAEASEEVYSAARPQLVTELPQAPPRSGPGVQASLFGPQPVVAAPEPAPATPKRSPAPRPKRDLTAQGRLDFSSEARPPAPKRSSVEPLICCNEPVAIPTHRILAAALDGSMGFFAVGVFIATFSFSGQEIVLTKHTIPLYVALALLITAFYRIVFCVAEVDTPGMRWAGLRLVNFDGHAPTREQRVKRMFTGFISFIAAGLGLMWALADPERLTWHDHLSRTFPTPIYE